MTVQINRFVPAPITPHWGPGTMNDRVRVLLVGAQPDQAWALQANLATRGYGVLVAGDGDGAVELLASQNPDIILLESTAPDLERWELLSRIRESSQAPVIMLAAPAGVADAVKGLRMGADDYMVKPVAIRELVARMQAILRRAV